MTSARVTVTLKMAPSREHGGSFAGPLDPGKSILRTLLDANVWMEFSCTEAVCGQDLIRVKRGAELLNATTDPERFTLGLLHAAADCRLACQCRVRDGLTEGGEVHIERVE